MVNIRSQIKTVSCGAFLYLLTKYHPMYTLIPNSFHLSPLILSQNMSQPKSNFQKLSHFLMNSQNKRMEIKVFISYTFPSTEESSSSDVDTYLRCRNVVTKAFLLKILFPNNGYSG